MKPLSRKPIFLVGHATEKIFGAKLPSKRQTLSFLFHKMRNEKADLKSAANEVIDLVNSFWEKSAIKVKQKDHSAKKLLNLHKEWRSLLKHKNRKGNLNRKKEQEFTNSLDDLFDIAHADALKSSSTHAKEFLAAQRKTGRIGCLMGTDKKQMEKEERVADRLEKIELRKRKYEQSKLGKIYNYLIKEFGERKIFRLYKLLRNEFYTVATTNNEDEDDDEIPSNHEETDSDSNNDWNIPSKRQRKESSSKQIFLNDDICAALDRYRISDRAAVHIFVPFLQSLGLDPNKYVVNRSSIQTTRSSTRAKCTVEAKNKFKVIFI